MTIDGAGADSVTQSPEHGAQGMGDATPRQRLRLRFSKGESLKYISHLDLNRTWERVFR